MDTDNFNQYESIMKLFIDNAKTYVQLSTGMLALSITFIEKVFKPPITYDLFLIGSWIAFLIAIGFGAYYQYLAVKVLEGVSLTGSAKIILPSWLKDPSVIYFIMMVTFYLGIVLFTIAAIKRVGR